MTSSPPASAGRPQRRLRRSARRQARAEARFVGGGEFTVGAEEELLLVGPDDQLQPGSAEPLLAAIDQQPGGTATHELFDSEIEFASAVGHNGEEVSDSLRTLREALGAAGGRPLAAGVHPAGAFADVGLTRSARYDPIGADLAGLLRTPTAALQVHVGMPDANAAMAAMGGLRHQLAMLRALTASSPYWHGRDSGLASARWAVLKSYPRSGVPPAVRNWEEYVTLTRALVAAAEVPDYTHVWWDLRAHPRFGTIEVRVMDTQPSLAVVAGRAPELCAGASLAAIVAIRLATTIIILAFI